MKSLTVRVHIAKNGWTVVSCRLFESSDESSTTNDFYQTSVYCAVQMAFTNNFFFIIIVVATIPFVENAPSNVIKKDSKDEQLQVKLVFIDRDGDNAITSPFKITDDTTSQTRLDQTQNSVLIRSKHFAKSTWLKSDSPLEIKPSTALNIPKMDDERQNWGIAVDEKDLVEDESYYSRPLALPKVIGKTVSQNKDYTINRVTKVSNSSVSKPSACDMSIVICCVNPTDLAACFNSQGCNNVTYDMFTHLCSPDSINRTLALLGEYYKGDPTK